MVFETKRFCPGNRIVTTQYAGSLKPAETGYPVELKIDAGHTATVIGNAPSPVTGQPALAKVEWDAQVWEDMEGQKVERPVIVDTIHADHINFLR
ncbi:hypothetical protein [uncultured Maritimibacter sp.]|uniref:hypothetical protein n=1 Tax=uncultured Maritimibacter sp. TaxID=991866 RepID=UPI00261E09E5|nr:hypothetical protein [uncultured Maritimibacter sp.]